MIALKEIALKEAMVNGDPMQRVNYQIVLYPRMRTKRLNEE